MPMNPRKLVPTQEPGILDFAPGAAAAYSMRNLSLSYSGPVVTVRRSTDNAEADFTASEVSDGTLAGWAGADGFVKQWWDQSGNARHATQATTTAQPQIVDSGVLVTQGGRASVLWDGSNDLLRNGDIFLSQPLSVFVVMLTTTTNLQRVFDTDGTPNRCNLTIDASFEFSLNAGAALSAPPPPQTDAQTIVYCGLNGASSTIIRNGATIASGDAGNGVLSTVRIGANHIGSQVLTGTISELIIYPTDMTALRTRIEGNLSWYY